MAGASGTRTDGRPSGGAERSGARTRELLLSAGVAVAEREGLAGLSVNRFADRESFLDALHERFHARVLDAVALATQGVPPGAERLWRASEAYLDVALRERAIKALTLEARTQGALTPAMSERHERFVAAAVPGFKAMGWPDAKAASQLLAAMTNEIAIRELDARRRLPAARRSLRRFLGL